MRAATWFAEALPSVRNQVADRVLRSETRQPRLPLDRVQGVQGGEERKVLMTRKFRAETNRLCDCGSGLPVLTHSRFCCACEAYNAAVAAQKAAAESFAKARCMGHVPGGAWLNKFGAFADDGKQRGIQVASAQEAKPFVELTESARRAAKLALDGQKRIGGT